MKLTPKKLKAIIKEELEILEERMFETDEETVSKILASIDALKIAVQSLDRSKTIGVLEKSEITTRFGTIRRGLKKLNLLTGADS